jgi:hypothetical protein
MPLDDFILGGQFTKDTLFRYLPVENLRCGDPYLLKGHGKGKIERIYAFDGRVITESGAVVPTDETREIEVRLQDGHVKRFAPFRTSRQRTGSSAHTKKSRASSESGSDPGVFILAGYKGIWLKR